MGSDQRDDPDRLSRPLWAVLRSYTSRKTTTQVAEKIVKPDDHCC